MELRAHVRMSRLAAEESERTHMAWATLGARGEKELEGYERTVKAVN